jgi:hypothetical protein
MSLVNETLGSETKTRPRRLVFCPRRDQDETSQKMSETETRPRRLKNRSRDRLETETSRPRLHPWSLVSNQDIFRFELFISAKFVCSLPPPHWWIMHENICFTCPCANQAYRCSFYSFCCVDEQVVYSVIRSAVVFCFNSLRVVYVAVCCGMGYIAVYCGMLRFSSRPDLARLFVRIRFDGARFKQPDWNPVWNRQRPLLRLMNIHTYSWR